MQKTPICYITDDNYTMPTIVSIVSLLKNKKETTDYKIYVIGVELSSRNKEAFRNIKEAELLNLENKYRNTDLDGGYVSKAALFKFDLAEIFDRYDKILYLDSDTLILKDIQEFLDIDINNYYAGAIKDIYSVLSGAAKEAGIEDDNYFNSGVMLLNIKKMREDNTCKKLLETKKELDLKTKRYMDQNAFNIVFKNKVKFLHPNFNFIAPSTFFMKKTLKKFFNTGRFSPSIIHHTYFKPWKYKDTKYASLWRKYYKMSVYKDRKLQLEKFNKFSIFKKIKFNDRWVVDFLGLRFSYKKGGKDFRIFYP